jgi:hypothetical protein
MQVTNLPLELYNYILEYEGSIRLRNGKYMNQIPKTDKRYKLLTNIIKMKVCHSYMLPIAYLKYINFSNNCRLVIRYSEDSRQHSYMYRYSDFRKSDEYIWS